MRSWLSDLPGLTPPYVRRFTITPWVYKYR